MLVLLTRDAPYTAPVTPYTPGISDTLLIPFNRHLLFVAASRF